MVTSDIPRYTRFQRECAVILAVTVTVACLKTAVGLITSCAETFAGIFPGGPSYRAWAGIFCLLSFLIANLGLDLIIAYSLPVLMFLYPPAIVLIVLTLFGGAFQNDRTVLRWSIGATGVAAVFDLLRALPEGTRSLLRIDPLIDAAKDLLPLSNQGFGWVVPALIGFLVGMAFHIARIVHRKI